MFVRMVISTVGLWMKSEALSCKMRVANLLKFAPIFDFDVLRMNAPSINFARNCVNLIHDLRCSGTRVS
jgi:hypothetical protein